MTTRGIFFVALAIMAAAVGFAIWQFVAFPWHTVEAPRLPRAQVHVSPAKSYVLVQQWLDLTGWKTNNLTMEDAAIGVPDTPQKATRLSEDTQNIWRNIQIGVDVAKARAIKITADIKADTSKRQAVVMLFSAPDRFSCNLDPATGKVAPFFRGAASVLSCAASSLPDGWWHVEVVGALPENPVADPESLTIAMTLNGFDEDYQGDGKSGLFIGAVTISQGAMAD